MELLIFTCDKICLSNTATYLAASLLFSRTTLLHTDFIAPALWPDNSPDLNPVDYQNKRKLRFMACCPSFQMCTGLFDPSGKTLWLSVDHRRLGR